MKYEVRLAEAVAEMGFPGMTSERVELCFSILGELESSDKLLAIGMHVRYIFVFI